MGRGINKELASKLKAVERELELIADQIATVRGKLNHRLDVYNRKKDKGRYDQYDALVAAGQADEAADYAKKYSLTFSKGQVERRQAELEKLEAAQKARKEVYDLLTGVFEFIKNQADAVKEVEGLEMIPNSQEWQSTLPNSRFKTFQELFTPPALRVIATMEGRYGEIDNQNDLPLEDLVFDPARLQDSFVEAFDLADLSGMSEYEKLRKKMDLKEDVVELFSDSRLLERMSDRGGIEGNPRLYVAPDGRIINVHQTPKNRFDEAHTKKRRKAANERKITAVYTDAYSFDRRNHYALDGYAEEIPLLAKALKRAEALHRSARAYKAGLPGSDLTMKRIQRDLDELHTQFQKATDFDKQQVAEVVEAIAELKDSMGRTNPGAAAASLLRAVQHLSLRREKASGREMAVVEDKQSVSSAIAEGEEVLVQCYYSLIQVCDAVERARPVIDPTTAFGLISAQISSRNLLSAFSDPSKVGDRSDHEFDLDSAIIFRSPSSSNELSSEAITKLLEEFDHALAPAKIEGEPVSLKVRPFNFFIERINQKLFDLEDAVKRSDYEGACEEALKAFVFAKLFQAHRKLKNLERVIALIDRDLSHFSLDDTITEFEFLSHILDQEQVFKGNEMKIYPDAYRYYSDMVKAVVAELQRIKNEGIRDQACVDSLKKLKEESLSHIFPEEMLLEE